MTNMKKKDELTQKQQKIFAIVPIALFATLFLFICTVIGVPMVRFASEPEKFRIWVKECGIFGPIAYIGMVILQVIAAVIPGEPLEIAGGYAFGAVNGTLLCLLASSVGSIIVLYLVRRFGMRLVTAFFPQSKLQNLRFLQSSPKRTLLFLLVFMIPGTPKDLLCYFIGLTDIKLPVLFIICSVGRIPSVVTSTIGGDALGTKSYLFAVVIFAAAFLISVTGLIIYNSICKRHNKE